MEAAGLELGNRPKEQSVQPRAEQRLGQISSIRAKNKNQNREGRMRNFLTDLTVEKLPRGYFIKWLQCVGRIHQITSFFF